MSHELLVQKLTQTVIERPIATLFFRSSLHFFVPKMIIVRSSASSMTKPDIANIPESLLTQTLKIGNVTCIEWPAAEFADIIPKKPLARFTIGYAKPWFTVNRVHFVTQGKGSQKVWKSCGESDPVVWNISLTKTAIQWYKLNQWES